MKSKEGIRGEEEDGGSAAEGVVHATTTVGQRTITTGANCAKGAFSDSLLSRGGGQMHG